MALSQRFGFQFLRDAKAIVSSATPIVSCLRNTSNAAAYFSEEAFLDPLKAKFDERQHRRFGSMDAIKLTPADQKRLMPDDNMSAVLGIHYIYESSFWI